MNDHRTEPAKKRPWLNLRALISITTFVLSVTALLVVFSLQGRAPQNIAPTEPAPPPFQYVVQTSAGDPGRLELFSVHGGALVKVTDYTVIPEDLPESDRQILRQGLALRNAMELQSALEDYLPHA